METFFFLLLLLPCIDKLLTKIHKLNVPWKSENQKPSSDAPRKLHYLFNSWNFNHISKSYFWIRNENSHRFYRLDLTLTLCNDFYLTISLVSLSKKPIFSLNICKHRNNLSIQVTWFTHIIAIIRYGTYQNLTCNNKSQVAFRHIL